MDKTKEIKELKRRIDKLQSTLASVQMHSYLLWVVFNDVFQTEADRRFVASWLGIPDTVRDLLEGQIQALKEK